jgi:hypothetical protein
MRVVFSWLALAGASALLLAACVGDEAVLVDDLPTCPSACAAAEECVQGVCVPACSGGTLRCGDRCVDPMLDPEHCGGCDRPCPAMEVCSQGGCGLTCSGGTTLCEGLCVDTQLDPNHCGDCNAGCGPGASCMRAECVYPADCRALHQTDASLGDGVYQIDPDGPGGDDAFAAHCDMTTEGGGWTLVASVVDNSYFAGTTCATACSPEPATPPCDETPFVSVIEVGNVSEMLTADHKSKAYATVPFSEHLFVDSAGSYAAYDVSGASVAAWFPAGLVNHVLGSIEAHPTFSYPVKATNVDPALSPCATLRVSFNVSDSDTDIGLTCHSDSKGPVWTNTNNDTCYWDDGGVPWTGGAFYAANVTTYRLWLVR